MTEKKKHKTVGKKRLTAEEEKVTGTSDAARNRLEKHIWHQKLKKLEEKRFEELEQNYEEQCPTKINKKD